MKMVLEVKDTGRPYEVDAKFNSLPFFASKWKADVFSLIVIAFFTKQMCSFHWQVGSCRQRLKKWKQKLQRLYVVEMMHLKKIMVNENNAPKAQRHQNQGSNKVTQQSSLEVLCSSHLICFGCLLLFALRVFRHRSNFNAICASGCL